MTEYEIVILIFVVHLIGRLAEYIQHRINRDFLIFIQAQERTPRVTLAFQLISILIIPLMIGGALGGGHELASRTTSLVCILGLLTTQILRIWCVNLEGRYWSLSRFEIEGLAPVRKGPYLLSNFPEAWTRLVDVAIFMVMTQSTVLGPIVILSMFFIIQQLPRNSGGTQSLSLAPELDSK